MFQIFSKANFKFIEWRKYAFIFSIFLIIVSISSLIIKGVNWGIDFTGGNLIQFSLSEDISNEEIREILKKNGIQSYSLQRIKEGSIILKIQKEMDDPQLEIENMFKQKNPNLNLNFERVEKVGPTVGKYLIKRGIYAFGFAFLGMLIYVAIRFKGGIWGGAAIIALIHDILIVFGLMSLLREEISLTVIAGFMTLAGYSINDTIVIFDRIREEKRKSFKLPFLEIINKGINSTLSRTILTAGTTLAVVLALFIWGGEVIHGFALTLLLGIIIGTYSSIFIASPLVFEWTGKKEKK